jgi:homoprotocatechuate degradation regulator HpaR
MALMRTREAVMKRFRPSLRDHDVTEQQWRVLRALDHAGPLEATDLARRTVLLAPSLSRIVRDLEARGLVERAVVRADLRRTRIRVSDQGAQLIAAIAPDSEATYDAIARRFGRDKLNALFALLNDLEQALGSSDGPDVSNGRDRTSRPSPATAGETSATPRSGVKKILPRRGAAATPKSQGGASPSARRDERAGLEARRARRDARKD